MRLFAAAAAALAPRIEQGVFLQAHRALCLLRSESVTAASNEECPATACSHAWSAQLRCVMH
ncbi:hypothetical protein [Xanthomonas hortorum]|uniref:hypothetical protein n=1 Tax=Xanthomonas hortorum TaxID=56454 RepID=UPI002935EC9B|nr:hypothetical protein [Xanthomonas hortorum]MDV2453628.1 hypothetical protein [Xanthomonas hortorum NBC5720]